METRLQLVRLLIVGSLVFGFSCSQESENAPTPLAVINTTADIQEQHGFLVFKNKAVYEEAIHRIGEVPA